MLGLKKKQNAPTANPQNMVSHQCKKLQVAQEEAARLLELGYKASLSEEDLDLVIFYLKGCSLGKTPEYANYGKIKTLQAKECKLVKMLMHQKALNELQVTRLINIRFRGDYGALLAPMLKNAAVSLRTKILYYRAFPGAVSVKALTANVGLTVTQARFLMKLSELWGEGRGEDAEFAKVMIRSIENLDDSALDTAIELSEDISGKDIYSSDRKAIYPLLRAAGAI